LLLLYYPVSVLQSSCSLASLPIPLDAKATINLHK